MASTKTKYTIYFYNQKPHKQISDNHLELEDCEFKEKFTFRDYDSQQNILDLKEYFLTIFRHKYPYCLCQLILCKKENNRFTIIDNVNKNLNTLNNLDLHLIKKDEECECELKDYKCLLLQGKYNIIHDFFLKSKSNYKNLYIEYGANKKEIKELKRLNDRISKVNELDNLKDDDYYDITIDIKSIKSIKEGWKINFSKEGKKRYEEYKNQKLLKIGVIGNSKKGKSFLLNKISKIDLKIGASNQTIGLSIKYPELQNNKNRHIIVLDSAGFERPILKEEDDLNQNKNKIMEEEEKEEKEEEKEKKEEKKEKENEKKQKKEFKERANDKAMTELFLTNFILKNSDILLLVVGELTYSEQLLIDKIKEESKKLKLKKIFIVHNLQTLRRKEQVKKYINNTLLKNINFNLIKPKLIDINEDYENDDQNKGKDIKNGKKDNINNINNNNLKKKEEVNNKINIKNNNLDEINLIGKKEDNIIKEIKKNEIVKDQNLINKMKKKEDKKIDLIENEEKKNNNEDDKEEDKKEENKKEEENKKDENEGKKEIDKDNLENNKNNDNDDSDSKSNENNDLKKNNNNINEDKKKDNLENNKVNNIIENKDNNKILENKEKKINKKYEEALHYCEVLHYDNGNIDIYHLILANEDSEAGQFYNEYAYSFIENRYNEIAEIKSFDALDEVKKVFKDIAPLILYKNIDINFDPNEDILNSGLIQLKSKDNIDESIFNNKKFQPKYNYFKPDEKTLEIRLEIPGNFECNPDYTIIGDKTKINFKGIKKPDKAPENPENNLENLREFTDFEFNILLPIEEFQIYAPKGEAQKKSGLYIVQYELLSKKKETSSKFEDDV